jgi:hypothetical protein
MKKLLIRTGIAAALTVAGASLAHAGHPKARVTLDLGTAVIRYDDGHRYHRYRHYDRHGWRHCRQHRHYHSHEERDHGRWHWYNDDRWDPFYGWDHARFHHERRHDHRDYHRRAWRHW